MISIILKQAKQHEYSIFVLPELNRIICLCEKGFFMVSVRPLSDLYQEYVICKLSKKDFIGKVFLYLLDNQERFHIFGGNGDYWNEYLSWLYPRLARSVELYRDLGSSFDAYITSLVHSAAKEYRRRETDHNITENICWQARAEEMIISENEPEYTNDRKDIYLPKDVSPRQILLLLLKSYFFVSDEFVDRVAKTIGMEFEEIQRMIDELRKRRAAKDTEILELRERIHCQHYRCLTYQKRLTGVLPGTVYYEKLSSRFERARKRFYAMKKRLGGMRMGASNRMIADIMGIPRGTVDSGLFAIRKRRDIKCVM